MSQVSQVPRVSQVPQVPQAPGPTIAFQFPQVSQAPQVPLTTEVLLAQAGGRVLLRLTGQLGTLHPWARIRHERVNGNPLTQNTVGARGPKGVRGAMAWQGEAQGPGPSSRSRRRRRRRAARQGRGSGKAWEGAGREVAGGQAGGQPGDGGAVTTRQRARTKRRRDIRKPCVTYGQPWVTYGQPLGDIRKAKERRAATETGAHRRAQ